MKKMANGSFLCHQDDTRKFYPARYEHFEFVGNSSFVVSDEDPSVLCCPAQEIRVFEAIDPFWLDTDLPLLCSSGRRQ